LKIAAQCNEPVIFLFIHFSFILFYLFILILKQSGRKSLALTREKKNTPLAQTAGGARARASPGRIFISI
jgi:hypothetical protein